MQRIKLSCNRVARISRGNRRNRLLKANPEDLAPVVKPPEFAEDPLVIGHLEYHPAVYEFMRAGDDNEFVQRTFDWTAWSGVL